MPTPSNNLRHSDDPRRKGFIFVVACVLVLATILPVKPATPQENRRVRIINSSSSSIYRLYASNVDSEDWEEDILGSETIPPGRSRIANIDDGTGHCRYDLKAVLYDGRTAIKRNFNVCAKASWTVTD
jgi:hypothetical protein